MTADLQILRPDEVAALIGVHRVTIYKWAREGRFPKPFKIGKRAAGFRKADVAAWLEARESAA